MTKTMKTTKTTMIESLRDGTVMNETNEKIRHLFGRVHVVAPNDTLASISKTFYNDEKYADDLARVNGIAPNAILLIGKKIKVPPLAKLSQPIVQRLPALGDASATDFTADNTVTVSATKPFYLNPLFYAGVIAGGGLAYLLLEYVFKKSRR